MLVSELIDRTYSEYLYPSGVERPAYDTLTANINNTIKTFTVSGRLQHIPRDGLLEISSELLLTESVDEADVTVNERGFGETTAVPHNAGDKVYLDPTFPRIRVFNAVNAVLGKLYPWGLYVRAVADDTYSSRQVKPLPSGGLRLLGLLVRRSVPPAAETWDPLRRSRGDYEVYEAFDPPKFQLLRGGGEGRALKVVYAKDFTLAGAETDDLTSLGVGVTLQPDLAMAVAGTLLSGHEVPRVQIESVGRQYAAERNQIPVGSFVNIGQSFLTIFRTQAVPAERKRLRLRDPVGFRWDTS